MPPCVRLLAFPREQLFDREAHLRAGVFEHAAGLACREVGRDELVAAVAERHVADFFGERAALGEVELDRLFGRGATLAESYGSPTSAAVSITTGQTPSSSTTPVASPV